MTKHQSECMRLGEMILGLIEDQLLVPGGEPAYSIRSIMTRSSKSWLILCNQEALVNAFDAAMQRTHNIAPVTMPADNGKAS